MLQEPCSLEPSICRERGQKWKSNYWVLGGVVKGQEQEDSGFYQSSYVPSALDDLSLK